MFIFALILILVVDYSYGGSKNSESVIGTERPSNSSLDNNAPSFTTKLLPNDQVLNQDGSNVTGESSKTAPPKYKIKVTFDSITIHSDHEGGFSGDGEFDLSAYVQGNRIDLTAATSGSICIGAPPGPPLYECEALTDAHDGRTYKFNPGTEITVGLIESIPLSIFTLGEEQDAGKVLWPADDDPRLIKLIAVLNDPNNLDKSQYIANFIDDVHRQTAGHHDAFNANDRLADILKFYGSKKYGAGSHADQSYIQALKDFTLRYTIRVTPPPAHQLGKIPTQVLEAVPLTCGSNLPVNTVTSSGSQSTFPPTNAVDNNPSTKWFSTNTLNPFITLNFGSQKSVCSIDIAWADGNLHPYKFLVSVSNDGNTFTNAFTGTSAGTTTSPEKYTFTAPQQAKFVKVTITQSTPGAPNSIAQISEIDLFGGDATSSKPIQTDDNLTFAEAEDIQLNTNLTNRSDLVSDEAENNTRMTDGEEQSQLENGTTENVADEEENDDENGDNNDGNQESNEAEVEDNDQVESQPQE